MANPLNAYATKVFSEQPLALWALDEPLDYISVFPAAFQDLSTWINTGIDSYVDASVPGEMSIDAPTAPMTGAYMNGIIANNTNNGVIAMVSPFTLQESDFSTKIKTFSFAFYAFAYTKIFRIKIGYMYYDPITQQTINPILKPAASTSSLAWAFVSESFALPETFEDLKLVIEIQYNFTGENDELVLSGFTAGQWAEEFQLKSFGSSVVDVPSEIDVLATKGIEAFSYGFDSVAGYYLADSNYLYARNNGVPIVFGSSGSTRITPKENSPSLIVPGFGFLNESGRYNDFTAEFWCNIQSNALEPRKIFGPISSQDGIYCEGPFIKIRVGEYTGAHYVGHWNRPMLINFVYSQKRIALILNGETVIEQKISVENLQLPTRIDGGTEQDWLGFYAYSDIPYMLIDSVSIYPYEVANLVAKRRWAYGQAVDYPANIKGLNSANSVVIDYPFSKYAKNYYFPSSAGWEGGLLENISVDRENLVPPQHSLPDVYFASDTLSYSDWISDLSSAQDVPSDPFISLRPNLSWGSTNGYIYYESLNFLQEDIKAFYSLFETETDSLEREVLFELRNDITSNKLQVYLENNTIYYVLLLWQSDGTYSEDVLYTALGQKSGDRFLVGLDIDRFVKYYGNKVSSFFGTKHKTRVYVGGSSNTKIGETFNGKIYRVSFCNARNLVKIKHFFSERGVPIDYENVFDLLGDNRYDAGNEYFGNDPSYWPLILDGGDPYDFVTIATTEHIATYTLMPKLELGNFKLDVATNSYWENYVPLSYFAKDVPDAYGEKRRKLDFIQFNLDFLKVFSFDGDYYNTNGLPVKAYVSLQPLNAGANMLQSSFTNTAKLHKNNVVRPGSEWINTKYEVVNGTIINFPTDIDFKDFSINVHLDIEVDGIYSNPFRMRSLQLSSQAFGAFPNKVGTRFGTDLIPYTKKGDYFEYQNAPNFAISKDSTPYLYLTDTSGIRLVGDYEASPLQGLSATINKSAASFYKLGTIQMSIRYDEELMPEAPVKIFEIKAAEQTTAFYLISDSVDRTRGQIYAVNDQNNRIQSNFVFFTNGQPVKRGILYPRTWSTLSISFPDFLTFAETVGAFRITSPIMVDNISLYETSLADDEERYGFRQWFSVRNSGGQDIEWGYWAGKELVGGEIIVIPDAGFTWQEVLFLAASQTAEIDAETIYKIFNGISGLVTGDDQVLTLNNYTYKALSNVAWSQNSVTPV